MRLRKGILHNFGSFADAVIDLSGMSTGVVTGPNGAGKSTAVVDSVLWCFFGECRVPMDAMVRLGADEMSVEWEWELNQQRYRVNRKRSLKTKAGSSELSVSLADGSAWTPVAVGMKLGQKKIFELLNADYQLLTSTGFLLQGQADRFSRSTAGERKAILAQILRLDQYGPLKQAATRHLTIADAKHGEKAGQLAALDEEASTIASLEARQTEINSVLVDSNKAIEQLEQHQQDLTTKKAAVTAELDQLAAIPQQIADLEQKQSSLLKDHATKTTRKEQAVAILDQRARIEAAVMETERLRRWEDTLTQEWITISGDLAAVKQALRAEHEQLDALPAEQTRVRSQRTTVQAEQEALLGRRERAQKILDHRATIEAKVKEESFAKQERFLLEEERKTLALDAAAVGTALADVRMKLGEGLVLEKEILKVAGEVDRQVRDYQADTDRILRDIDSDERASTLLKKVPCGADLQGQCQFTLQAVEAERRLPASRALWGARFVTPGNEDKIAPAVFEQLTMLRARHAQWEQANHAADVQGLEERVRQIALKQDDCETRLAANRTTLTEMAKFTALVPELEAAAREVVQLDLDLAQRAHVVTACREELTLLEQRVLARTDAVKAVEVRIDELTAQMNANDTERQEIKTSLAKLALLTDLAPQLGAAEREVASVDEDLATVMEGLNAVDYQLQRLQLRLEDRVRLTTDHSRLTAEWQQDSQYLTRLRTDGQTAIGRLKELELEIKRAQDAGRQAEQLRQECASLLVDGRHFQALATAYAQIPVLILESSIPLLEEEANRILGKISSSGLRVTVDTQKALKSRDGLAETLDIKVRDVFGERMLENYSGGERARVDLAIRIGLSRLLANRAGARLETLVVDEAFAAVDREGVEQLVECLPMLSQEFPLILFITHDESFKSAIAQQILVTKGPSGSQVAVVA